MSRKKCSHTDKLQVLNIHYKRKGVQYRADPFFGDIATVLLCLSVVLVLMVAWTGASSSLVASMQNLSSPCKCNQTCTGVF